MGIQIQLIGSKRKDLAVHDTDVETRADCVPNNRHPVIPAGWRQRQGHANKTFLSSGRVTHCHYNESPVLNWSMQKHTEMCVSEADMKALYKSLYAARGFGSLLKAATLRLKRNVDVRV